MKEHLLLGKPYHVLKRNFEFTKFMEEGMELKERIHEERNVYDPESKILIETVCRCSRNNSIYIGMLFLTSRCYKYPSTWK